MPCGQLLAHALDSIVFFIVCRLIHPSIASLRQVRSLVSRMRQLERIQFKSCRDACVAMLAEVPYHTLSRSWSMQLTSTPLARIQRSTASSMSSFGLEKSPITSSFRNRGKSAKGYGTGSVKSKAIPSKTRPLSTQRNVIRAQFDSPMIDATSENV